MGHAPSQTDAAHSRKTHRIDAGRGCLLRDTPYTGKCGVKVSVAVASKLLHMTGSERFFAIPSSEDVAKFLRSNRGEEEPRLPQNLHGHSRGRVPTGGGIHGRVTDIEVRILVPSVIKCDNMRYVASTPALMTTNLQIHLRAEDMMWYTVRSPGWEWRRATSLTVWPWTLLRSTWGGSPQASHTQTHRVNSLRRCGGGAAFSPNGVQKGGRPAAVRKVCMFVHSVCSGLSKPTLLGVKVL